MGVPVAEAGPAGGRRGGGPAAAPAGATGAKGRQPQQRQRQQQPQQQQSKEQVQAKQPQAKQWRKPNAKQLQQQGENAAKVPKSRSLPAPADVTTSTGDLRDQNNKSRMLARNATLVGDWGFDANSGMRTIGDGRWMLDADPIGAGSFSIVWRATNAENGMVAACKEITTHNLSPAVAKSLAGEIKLMREMPDHEHIVGLVELIKTPGKVFMLLDYCPGGDLKGYIRRWGRVSERVGKSFMRQVADGMAELRLHKIVHRDLKPQNLLLTDDSRHPQIRIADFGFARSLTPETLASTMCGSPHYMAPEIMLDAKYDATADLWSIGVILHELLTGRIPFTGANHMGLLDNIKTQEKGLKHTLPRYLSPSCRDLILGLLHRQPSERLTFEEFFDHPWITGVDETEDYQASLVPSPNGASRVSSTKSSGQDGCCVVS